MGMDEHRIGLLLDWIGSGHWSHYWGCNNTGLSLIRFNVIVAATCYSFSLFVVPSPTTTY